MTTSQGNALNKVFAALSEGSSFLLTDPAQEKGNG